MAAEPHPPAPATIGEGAYRALLEAAPDIIVVFDGDGRIRYVNSAITTILGHETSAVIGRRIQDYIHPEDLARAAERVTSIQSESPAKALSSIYRLRTADGGYRSVETQSLNRVDDPAIQGILVIARDVTRRVQNESSRLAAEERRRLAAEIARIGIWEWNVENNVLEADEAVRQLARQYEGQVWTGPQEFLERFVEEDRPGLRAAVSEAIAGRSTCRQVARMPMPDGSRRWLYIYARRQVSADGPSPWVVGLIMDITDQKLAEEEALRQGELLQLASRGAGIGIWNWYPQQDFADMDEVSLELHGLPGSHPRRSNAECYSTTHPDDLPELHRLEDELTAGRCDRFDYAYRARRPGGGWRWLMDRSRVTDRDPQGRVTRVSGVTLDIDAEKAREAELTEQRVRLALALKASRQGLWDLDVEAGEQYVDDRFVAITGLDAAVVRRRPAAITERIHEQDRPRFAAAASACIAGEREEISFEGRLMTPEGHLKWVSIDGAVVSRSPDGRATRVIGTLADITERRRIDDLIGAGEFVAASGSYQYDASSERVYWSRGTYRVFEYPEDFVPRHGAIERLLLPSSRAKTVQALQALREDGREFDLEAEAQTASGRRIWVRIMGRSETFAGRPVRFYGIVQDITARKRLEASLVDAANREQQRLGRELHDGLGQELTGISMHLQGLSSQLSAANPGLAGPVEHVANLLATAIRNARMLAHGLAPVSSGKGGLEAALQRLARDSTTSYGIPVSVSFDLRRPLRLDDIAGGDLYRICQEALSNAARHGKPSRVQVRLASTADALTLEILDDGCGIPPEGARGTGMGLQSMNYRADKLHGTLEVGRHDAGGTCVRVRVPLAG